MAQIVRQDAIDLARTLHPRLQHLFKRWPATLQPVSSQQNHSLQSDTASSASPDSQAPNSASPSDPTVSPYLKVNPFMPWRNPSTGRWHGPHYSLRRQAELFKLAEKYNVLPLMPTSPKHPAVKAKRLEERQGPMRTHPDGALRVKGKKWERQLRNKIRTRTEAMLGMPKLIKQWRLSGNGKGWKKWPK